MAQRERNIPEEFKDREIYSFSKLSSFLNCPRGYYYNYVLKEKGEQNIFAHLGGKTHELLEDGQRGLMHNEEAVNRLKTEILKCDIEGKMKFSSPKVKKNFVESIEHYLINYKPINAPKYSIEEEFYVDIEGVVLVGYIDLIVYNEDGSVDIIDYKTSTKYDKNHIDKHGMQLVLYAMALEKNKGLKINKIKWDMLKYCIVEWEGFSKTSKKMQRMCLRNEFVSKIRKELIKRFEKIGGYSADEIETMVSKSVEENSLDNLPDEVSEYFTVRNAYVEYPYNEETQKALVDFVVDTVEKINECKEKNENEWDTLELNKGSFFCGNLCGHKKRCDDYHSYLKEAENRQKFKPKINLAEQLFGRGVSI